MLNSEQCHNLVAGTFKTSCKTGEGIEEMFAEIAKQLIESNRSRFDLEILQHANNVIKLTSIDESEEKKGCFC